MEINNNWSINIWFCYWEGEREVKLIPCWRSRQIFVNFLLWEKKTTTKNSQNNWSVSYWIGWNLKPELDDVVLLMGCDCEKIIFRCRTQRHFFGLLLCYIVFILKCEMSHDLIQHQSIDKNFLDLKNFLSRPWMWKW